MSIFEANAQWANTLVHNLAAAGVTQVVVSPGSRNTPLVLACDRCPQLNIEVVLDERAAAFVALGMSRVSGTPTALVCTSGSACAHYLPAIIEARYSRIPLIVMSADRPAELHNCGAPQTINQEQIFGDHVVASFELKAPNAGEVKVEEAANLALQAVKAAVSSPPGPVHLNLPFREPMWEASNSESSFVPHIKTMEVADLPTKSTLSTELAQSLSRYRHGLIVCGPNSGITDPTLAPAVAQLAEQLQWPILADPISGLRFGRHELTQVVAGYDAFLRDPKLAGQLLPECIVQVGQSPTSKALNQWIEKSGVTEMLLIDPDGQWHNPSRTAHRLLTAPAAGLCRDTAQELAEHPTDSEWLQQWKRVDHACSAALAHLMEKPLWEGQVAHTIAHALPEGCALHVASSMPIRDLDSFSGCQKRDISVFANRGANGIDGTLATAAGEAIARRSPLCVVLGDLAFLHDLSGLLTARQLGAQLTVVVVDNGGGGIFGNLPIAAHPTVFERYFLTPQDADIEALASACGAHVSRPTNNSELKAELLAELERPRLSVVLLTVDRAHNQEQHANAWQLISRALDKGGLQ